MLASSILLCSGTLVSAQSQPRQPATVQPDLAKPIPGKPVPAKPVPVQSLSVQPIPALPKDVPNIGVGKLPTPTVTGVLTAVERGFDTPSKAIAQTLESVLSLFGPPNAYIIGNDVSGAFLVGGRFGTGFLHSTIAPPNPVRWRALSAGLGLGANYGRVVMLVYGIDKLEDIFGLYASLEGNFHVIIGANTSIMTRGPVSIIIISSGLGLRLSGDASGILIDKDN